MLRSGLSHCPFIDGSTNVILTNKYDACHLQGRDLLQIASSCKVDLYLGMCILGTLNGSSKRKVSESSFQKCAK
jgi:hypothetical protein